MNEQQIKYLLVAVGGVLAGFGLGYLSLKRRFDRELNQELDVTREAFSRRLDHILGKTESPHKAERPDHDEDKVTIPPSVDLKEYAEQRVQYNKTAVERIPMPDGYLEGVTLITEEEMEHLEDEGYDAQAVTWYEGSRLLIDELSDTVIEDWDLTVGETAIASMKACDGATTYVKNDGLMTVFEISYDPDEYAPFDPSEL